MAVRARTSRPASAPQRRPTLDADRARALREAMRAGDPDARERLMVESMPLARLIARKHTRGGFARLYEDTEAEVYAALPEAIDTWNPDRAGLSYWIEKKALHGIRGVRLSCSSPIELPRAYRRLVLARWSDQGDAGPSATAAIRAGRTAVSVGWTSDEVTHVDAFHPADHRGRDPDAAMDADRLLVRVPQNHRRIVAEVFGVGGRKPRTMAAVARGNDVSESRISQIVSQSIGLMKEIPVSMATLHRIAENGDAPRKSHCKGVTWDDRNKRWRAGFMKDGVQHFLGAFVVEGEAVKAMLDARAGTSIDEIKARPKTGVKAVRAASVVAPEPEPTPVAKTAPVVPRLIEQSPEAGPAVVVALPEASASLASLESESAATYRIARALRGLDPATVRRVLAAVVGRLGVAG
jgi:hypothetical protein